MTTPALMAAMGGSRANKNDPSSYDDAFISGRMSNGADVKRKATYDQWLAQAKAGDQVALRKLYLQADPDGPGGYGAGTWDSRNYLRMILREVQPQLRAAGFDPQRINGYEKAGDAEGLHLGKTLGGALKFAAPFASFIPGVGPMLGAGLAMAGSAAGGALHGDKFNIGKTLMAGASGYAGSKLLGGEGFHGIGGAPGRIGQVLKSAGSIGGGGNPIASLIGPDGKINPLGAINAIGSVAGAADSYGRAKSANRAMTQGRDMAVGAYNQRRPIGDAANAALLSRMGAMGGEPPTDIFSSHFKPQTMLPAPRPAPPMDPAMMRAFGMN